MMLFSYKGFLYTIILQKVGIASFKHNEILLLTIVMAYLLYVHGFTASRKSFVFEY